MKRLKFATQTLNIKEESLHRIIDAAVSSKSITREDVRRNVGVSLATAGKLLSALDECGFTKTAFDRLGERNGHEKIHIFASDISVLVLDFSSYKYSASIIFERGKRVINETYTYDPSVSFENNVLIFLSSVGKKVSALEYSVSSICTILADDPENAIRTSVATASYLPRVTDLQIIDGICYKFFKLNTVRITLSDAIRCASKYGYADQRKLGNVSYIRLFDSFSAFYLPKKQSAIAFRSDKLLCDGIPFSDILSNTELSRDLAKLLMRVANIMDCAYPTDSFLIEYDRSAFDEKLEEYFYLSFKAAEIPIPYVEFWSCNASPSHLGASAFALSELIKKHALGV